ncbi:MAG: 2-C-methyl-D-erythritol 4-phosphate cytidylyltransferase [Nitrospirae bacterium]|nr:2-C-methyl-D-erythritol 4-phosphate cytidylyltransferase [Nitrospirota bacterium]
MTLRVAAVIPAAGVGRRMGLATPKQFLSLDGVPILVHTLRVFEASPLVHEICVVVPGGMEGRCRGDLVKPYGLKKVTRVAAGGPTRQDSVYHGLMTMSGDVTRVVVHDGVRPFLSMELLERLVKAVEGADGAIAAVPMKDTPKSVRDDGTVASTLDRTGLYLAQTPQVFQREILTAAYEKAYADGVNSTDDSALVERLGYRVRVVEGSWDNIKITTAHDLRLAEEIVEMRRRRNKRKTR